MTTQAVTSTAPSVDVLAAVLARSLERRDIRGLPQFSDDVPAADIHRFLEHNRQRCSETVLLTRCLKFLDFLQVFERLTRDLSDSDRCDTFLKALDENVRTRSIQAGDCTYSRLVAKVRSWYLGSPIIGGSLSIELRFQVENAIPGRQELLPDYIDRFNQL